MSYRYRRKVTTGQSVSQGRKKISHLNKSKCEVRKNGKSNRNITSTEECWNCDECTSYNDPSSWDTMSETEDLEEEEEGTMSQKSAQVQEEEEEDKSNIVSSVQIQGTTDHFPSELPLLCNIAQKVFREADGAVEVVVFDMDVTADPDTKNPRVEGCAQTIERHHPLDNASNETKSDLLVAKINDPKCHSVPIHGDDVLRTDACLLPKTKCVTSELFDSPVGENDHNHRDQVHYTLRIIKSKSYDNLIQGSDILRECHTAVPYDQVIKKKGCLDKVQVEKDYPKTFPEVKEEKIGDLPSLKDLRCSDKRTSSACSILQKYIYLEEPHHPLATKEGCMKQSIECQLLSTSSNKRNAPGKMGAKGSRDRVSSKKKEETVKRGEREVKKEVESLRVVVEDHGTQAESRKEQPVPSHTGPLVLQRQLQLGLTSRRVARFPFSEKTRLRGYDALEGRDAVRSIVHVDRNLLPTSLVTATAETAKPWKQIGFTARETPVIQFDSHSKEKGEGKEKTFEDVSERLQYIQKEEREVDKAMHKTIELEPNIHAYKLPWVVSSGKNVAGEPLSLQIITDESTPLTRLLFLGSFQEVLRALREVQRELQNSREQLVQSELSMKRLLAQYVRHLASDQQLLRVLEVLSHRQVEDDQHARCTAHRLIREQMQALRSLQESSENHMLSLVRQNRALEEENIKLLHKHEKVPSKKKQGDDVESNLSQNNEILRNKLTKSQNNLSELENAYIKLIHSLEEYSQELHSLHLDAESQKVLHYRSEADFNIEKEYLIGELEMCHKMIQEISQSADGLINDLENVKNKLGSKKTNSLINWERLKGEGCSIPALLDICHSCIQEVGLEVVSLHQELATKEKMTSEVKERNENLQQVLQELDTEYNKLRQQCETAIGEKINLEKQLIKILQETDSLKEQLSKSSLNTSVLESEIEELNKIKIAVKEQESLKSKLEKSIQDLEAEKNTAFEKLMEGKKTEQTMELDLVKMTATLDMYEASNKELLVSNSTLKEKLESSFKLLAGLECFPQKYDDLKSKYHKVLAEKDFLNQDIETLKADLKNTKDSNANFSNEIDRLTEEIHSITKENLENKWEIKNLKDVNKCLEHDNCNMLRRLEDDTLQRNTEVSNVQCDIKKLEEVIEEQDKEMEELKKVLMVQSETMCTLQKDCDTKREMISKLEGKCEELKEEQRQNENQICVLKNKIQELDNEKTKISESNANTIESIRYEFDSLETTLKITQDDLNNTSVKLKEQETSLKLAQDNLAEAETTIQEKQQEILQLQNTIAFLKQQEEEYKKIKASHSEMQRSLKDHENIVKEWTKLKEYQTRLQIENETLNQNLKIFQSRYDTLSSYYMAQKEEVKKLKLQLFTLQDNLSQIEKSNKSILAEVQATYDGLSTRCCPCDLDDLFGKEKQDEIEEKTSRLQSQVRLLHELHKRTSNELLITKRTVRQQEEKIKELTAYLECEMNKRKILEQDRGNTELKLKMVTKEIEDLHAQRTGEAQNNLQLKEEFLSHEKEKYEKEVQLEHTIQALQQELEEYKKNMASNKLERDEIEQELETKRREMLELNQKIQELESRFSDYGRTLTHLADEKRRAEQLSGQLQLAQTEATGLRALQGMARQQSESLEAALQDAKMEAERARGAAEALQRRVDELQAQLQEAQGVISKQSEETMQMVEANNLLKSSKEELERIYEELLKEKERLEIRGRKLSMKLLRALKEVYDIKEEFRATHEKMVELSNLINMLQEQKAQKCAEVSSLSAEIAQLNLSAAHRSEETSRTECAEEALRQEKMKLREQVVELQDQLARRKRKSLTDMKKMEDVIIIKDDTIAQCAEQIRSLQEQCARLSQRLSENQNQLLRQRQEQRALELQLMTLQAEKRDLTMRLMLAESHLEEEIQRRTHLEEVKKKFVEKREG